MFIRFLILAVLAASPAFAHQPKILDRPDSHFYLYLWGQMDFKGLSGPDFDTLANGKDPLRMFMVTFRLLHDAHRNNDAASLEAARRVLDYMQSDYQPAVRSNSEIGWQYGFDYDGLKAPWHSGMDQFLGALSFFAAYELTGEDRYQVTALQAIERGMRSPPDGGSLWREASGCFFSEYAFPGMARNDDKEVYNGHLYALLAIALLKDRIEELSKTYDCLRDGTAAMQDRYVTPDWAWYQTNPKVAIPTHYLLIEIGLLRSLYEVTGDDLYKRDEESRTKLYLKNFPPHWSDTQVTMTTYGGLNLPHPDSYNVVITCAKAHNTVDRFVTATHAGEPCSLAIDADTVTLPLGPLVRAKISPPTKIVSDALRWHRRQITLDRPLQGGDIVAVRTDAPFIIVKAEGGTQEIEAPVAPGLFMFTRADLKARAPVRRIDIELKKKWHQWSPQIAEIKIMSGPIAVQHELAR